MPAEESRARLTVALSVTLVLFAIVVCVTSATSSRAIANTRVAFTYPSGTSEWCMPISRAAVIDRVRRFSDEVPANARIRAKLFGTDYWAVEVEGSVTPAFARGGPFGWAVYDIDAHTGAVKGVTAGPPGSTPSDWNSLPDRTSICTPGATTP